jgi:hypothetical protein
MGDLTQCGTAERHRLGKASPWPTRLIEDTLAR